METSGGLNQGTLDGDGWSIPAAIHGNMGAPIAVLNLSIRCVHVLERLRIETVGQLLACPKATVWKARGCGLKSILEIERELFRYLTLGDAAAGIDVTATETPATLEDRGDGSAPPDLWPLPAEIKGDLHASLTVLDLSVRATGVLKRLRAKTVGQLFGLTKRDLRQAKNCGRKTIAEIESKLLDYLSSGRASLAAFADPVPESYDPTRLGTKAFVEGLLSVLPERSRLVITARYGLWDGITETLQDIGDKLGRTRERIRQIEGVGLKRLRWRTRRMDDDFVRSKVSAAITQSAELRGVVAENELVKCLADDCTPEESGLALALLTDLAGGPGSLGRCFKKVEEEVYCLTSTLATEYRAALGRVRRVLERENRPLTEHELCAGALGGDAEAGVAGTGLLRRVLTVSPSITRLKGGHFALSTWVSFRGRNALGLAEFALMTMGKPAHFTEIAARIAELYPELIQPTEGTVHNALANREKFVWVKSGTYGLKAWGLKQPPYIKDRLVQILSEGRYPLPYWYLQQKVLEVCYCKEQSVRMTLDLNPKLFKKYDNDQYTLRSRGRSRAAS